MANRPFTHEWPWLAWPSLLGTMRTTSSPFISARNEQPTPQYAQVVTTLCSAWPMEIKLFSDSVAVGQACTQAPHETHSESMTDSFWLGETLESKPRPWMVSAKVPCCSSQARTQREQTMHLLASKVKYGLLVSFSAER